MYLVSHTKSGHLLQTTIVRPSRTHLESIKTIKEHTLSLRKKQTEGTESVHSSTPVVSGSKAKVSQRREATVKRNRNKTHQMEMIKIVHKSSMQQSLSSNEEKHDERVDASSSGKRVRSKDHIQVIILMICYPRSILINL